MLTILLGALVLLLALVAPFSPAQACPDVTVNNTSAKQVPTQAAGVNQEGRKRCCVGFDGNR